MKKYIILLFFAFLSLPCLAKDNFATDSPLSIDGSTGFRRTVCSVRNSTSFTQACIFECVTDSTADARHMYYEFVTMGMKDNSTVSSSTSSVSGMTFTQFSYDKDLFGSGKEICLFLGFTREQAIATLEAITELKEDHNANAIWSKGHKMDEIIYRFHGSNSYLPEGEEDVVHIRRQDTEKMKRNYVLRCKYNDKAYLAYKSIKAMVDTLSTYEPLPVDAPVAGNDLNEFLDYSEHNILHNLGINTKGYGFVLSDCFAYYATKPLYPDERFQLFSQNHIEGDIIPFGESMEDMEEHARILKEAVEYAAKHNSGAYVDPPTLKDYMNRKALEKKLSGPINPQHKVTIGNCSYTMVCWDQKLKNVLIVPERYGCRSICLAPSIIEQMANYFKRSVPKLEEQ